MELLIQRCRRSHGEGSEIRPLVGSLSADLECLENTKLNQEFPPELPSYAGGDERRKDGAKGSDCCSRFFTMYSSIE